MENIKVTIGIPVYNAEDYIRTCIESIPVRDDIEIIVVDDCCTDGTCDIVLELSAKYKNYSVYRTVQNSGVAVCRNLLLDKAKGEYIFFLDADDKLNTPIFEYIMDNVLTDQNILIPKYRRNDGFSGYPTILRGCFVKLSYIGSIRHDESRRCFEDTDFKKRLANSKGGTLDQSGIDLVVYYYNIPRVGSVTWEHWKEKGLAAYQKDEKRWEKFYEGVPR